MKRLLLTATLIVAGLTMFPGCYKFEYTGEELAPTDSVVVYNEDEKIDRPYVVIGQLAGSKNSFSSMGGLRKAMVKEAAKRGADAIAFMADTEVKDTFGEPQHAGGVAGPMERPGFTKTVKGYWALLIKFK